MYYDSYYELCVPSDGMCNFYKQFKTYDEVDKFLKEKRFEEYSLYYCVVKEIERRTIHDKHNK